MLAPPSSQKSAKRVVSACAPGRGSCVLAVSRLGSAARVVMTLTESLEPLACSSVSAANMENMRPVTSVQPPAEGVGPSSGT